MPLMPPRQGERARRSPHGPRRTVFAFLASAPEERELGDWKKFRVFQLTEGRAQFKSIVDTCGALSRKMVDGAEDAEARLVVMVYQDPDLKDGIVEPCVVCESSILSPPGHLPERL